MNEPREPQSPSPVSSAAPGDESLEPLRSALDDLRREIRARLPEARGRSGRVEQIDWVGLYDQLRRRMATLGMSARDTAVDEFGADAGAIERARPLLDLLSDRYWRVEVFGLARLPRPGPCLLVANRSGLLPYDGLMLAHVIDRWGPYSVRPRFLVADWLITLPFAQAALARLGGLRACRENADRLLRTGHSVVAFPEGEKGAAKVFRERYRLKRFGRGGIVRAAIENDVPLVPVGVVGAEELHPILFKSHTPARLLGLPFIPVTPTFPLLGPLGALPLPSKWIVNFGEPIDLEAPSKGRDEELRVSQLTQALRHRIQQLIDEGLDRRDSVWS